MGEYTVIGLRNAGRGGELTVAAVVSGPCHVVDDDIGMDEYASRWAQGFEADSPEEAEEMARRYCLEEE